MTKKGEGMQRSDGCWEDGWEAGKDDDWTDGEQNNVFGEGKFIFDSSGA